MSTGRETFDAPVVRGGFAARVRLPAGAAKSGRRRRARGAAEPHGAPGRRHLGAAPDGRPRPVRRLPPGMGGRRLLRARRARRNLPALPRPRRHPAAPHTAVGARRVRGLPRPARQPLRRQRRPGRRALRGAATSPRPGAPPPGGERGPRRGGDRLRRLPRPAPVDAPRAHHRRRGPRWRSPSSSRRPTPRCGPAPTARRTSPCPASRSPTTPAARSCRSGSSPSRCPRAPTPRTARLRILEATTAELPGRHAVAPAPPAATWVDGRPLTEWGAGRKIQDGRDRRSTRPTRPGRARRWRSSGRRGAGGLGPRPRRLPPARFNPVRGDARR